MEQNLVLRIRCSRRLSSWQWLVDWLKMNRSETKVRLIEKNKVFSQLSFKVSLKDFQIWPLFGSFRSFKTNCRLKMTIQVLINQSTQVHYNLHYNVLKRTLIWHYTAQTCLISGWISWLGSLILFRNRKNNKKLSIISTKSLQILQGYQYLETLFRS